MPYREGKKWRGVVTYQGARHQALLPTKREAAQWENRKRTELETKEKKQHAGMDLMTFCTKYLDYCQRYTLKTYDEKRTLCRRVIGAWGPETLVQDIMPDMVLEYLDGRAKSQSANAFNKDRKNLLSMWNWGQDILDLPNNPLTKIKKRPHDRETQYTPSTEDVLKVLAVADRTESVMLNCYLQTAARRSEIFRWTWVEDINFERREYRLGTRKTKDGSMEYEWFPMSDELYENLWWWWQNRPIKDTPFTFVSVQPGPGYMRPYKERRRFLKGLCKRAGVRPFGFHALRRYVASVLADTHKVSAKRIQRVLRHKSVTTTERYIHNINQDLAETLNLLSQSKIPEDPTRKPKGVSHEDG
ncbi:MAG: tyrosine-type recombinase/integrase [Proteobacteria bacterium]|nr:tyrosine-type recombinase/integrase [Pseudomonadota bacterium]